MHEYSVKFTQLSSYASEMVVEMRRRMSFIESGLSLLSSKEGKSTMLIEYMDINKPKLDLPKRSISGHFGIKNLIF